MAAFFLFFLRVRLTEDKDKLARELNNKNFSDYSCVYLKGMLVNSFYKLLNKLNLFAQYKKSIYLCSVKTRKPN